MPARRRTTRAPAVVVAPMLATATRGDAPPPRGAEWTYEPKYDGVRAVAVVAGATPGEIALFSRNGNDKSAQFPEVVEALVALARARAPLREPIILDGELVALDERGIPAGFQKLQGRMHATRNVHAKRGATPSAYVAFDILADGSAAADEPLVREPWTNRRKMLERVLSGARSAKSKARPERSRRDPRRVLRISETSPDHDAMERRARAEGWEGLIAKRVDAPYRPGQRSREWLKLKLEGRQELVIGGWTDPEGSRVGFGALVVGTYDDAGQLVYAGRVGTGFDRATLRDLRARLEPLATSRSPFASVPPELRRAHWVRPELVAEVKFTEWTAGGNLRHPSFQGLRDDKDARAVRREGVGQPVLSVAKDGVSGVEKGEARPERSEGLGVGSRSLAVVGAAPRDAARRLTNVQRPAPAIQPPLRLLTRLTEIEGGKSGGGPLALPGGVQLPLTNLGRVVLPAKTWRGRAAAPAVTKGDLLRYYAQVAHAILPAVAGRPLVLKRYREGAEPFYQQHVNQPPPAGVRTAVVAGDEQPRFIGGDLQTLLYVVQLGAVSIDPWHARVASPETPDYMIIDLDPGPGVKFSQVIDCARWVGEALDRLELFAIPKTSGASGMHIVVPLPAGVPTDAARLLAELVASTVADQHPKHATIVRGVQSRPRGTIYVDYLQNIRGKTVASVYSARAVPGASVSTPLKWPEVVPGLDPRDFTIANVPHRLAEVGDLWAAGMRRGNSLDHLLAATEGSEPAEPPAPPTVGPRARPGRRSS